MMKKVLCLLLFCSGYVAFGQDLSGIITSGQAYQYARDHMWSEVQLLSHEDSKWLMNTDRSKEPSEPQPGDFSTVRNSMYKIIADTELVLIQCAVIDFDTRKMDAHSIDSIRNKMLIEFAGHGSFEQLAKDHLPADEMYRFQVFSKYTHQIEEMLDDNFVDRKAGDIFRHELSRSNDFMFLVFIKENPKIVDGYIVLKTRLNEDQ